MNLFGKCSSIFNLFPDRHPGSLNVPLSRRGHEPSTGDSGQQPKSIRRSLERDLFEAFDAGTVVIAGKRTDISRPARNAPHEGRTKKDGLYLFVRAAGLGLTSGALSQWEPSST